MEWPHMWRVPLLSDCSVIAIVTLTRLLVANGGHCHRVSVYVQFPAWLHYLRLISYIASKAAQVPTGYSVPVTAHLRCLLDTVSRIQHTYDVFWIQYPGYCTFAMSAGCCVPDIANLRCLLDTASRIQGTCDVCWILYQGYREPSMSARYCVQDTGHVRWP